MDGLQWTTRYCYAANRAKFRRFNIKVNGNIRMIDQPYQEFSREDMILRDWLALDRTVLANKRTFLAFGRTSIALIALGIAFMKLIDHTVYEFMGVMLIMTGIVVFFVGLREYIHNKNRFKGLVEKERAWEEHMHEIEMERKS